MLEPTNYETDYITSSYYTVTEPTSYCAYHNHNQCCGILVGIFTSGMINKGLFLG